MKRKNSTMVRGVAGRVKAFLPFCLFTLLPLNIHAQQISAKNEVSIVVVWSTNSQLPPSLNFRT